MNTGTLFAPLLLLALLNGCAFERTAYFAIGDSWEGTLSTQAWGYPVADTGASTKHAIYNRISINLLRARPFLLYFPDGTAVKSTELTESLVRSHLAPLHDFHVNGHFLIHEPDSDSRRSMYLGISTNGQISSLSIGACNFPFRNILGSMDGRRFNVPMDENELIQLLGKPDKTLNSVAGSIAWENDLCPRE